MKFAVTMTALLMLAACGGDPAPGAGASGGSAANGAGDSADGPDTSGLADIVLGKINADPTRKDMKVTGKLVEFAVTSSTTEVYPGMGADAVVECAGVVIFDGDVQWNYQDTAPRKAGEPAKFECKAEYQNQGSGWQLFGPMGIYPL